jgi:hypothetical protein
LRATIEQWDGGLTASVVTDHAWGVIDVDWDKFLTVLLTGLTPVLPQLAVLAAVIIVVGAPLPGRGPRLFQREDPWRRFKYGSRDVVMSRAGHRCEGAVFLVWGRCEEAVTEADHVYPWARGGPTVPSNGQALCRGHNKHKGAMRPPWWYLLSLEHRRRSYFPPGTDVRVLATFSDADRQARASAPERELPR